jgi:hypothetical protein
MNKVASAFSNVKQPVSALEAKLDTSGKSLKEWNMTVEETEAAARAGVSPAIVAMDALFGTHMTQEILKNAGALDEHGKIMVNWDGKAKTVAKTASDLGAGFKDSSADFTVWATEMLDAGKSSQQVATWLHDSQIKEADALKILDAAMVKHLDNLNKLIPLQKTVASTNLFKIWEEGGSKMATITNSFGANLTTLKAKFLALHDAQKDLFGTNLDNSSFFQWLSNPNPTAITTTVKDFANLAKLADQTNTTAKQLNQTWEKDAGAIAAKNTAKALEEAKKKADAFKQSLAAAQTDIKGVFKIDSNADKILKDLINKLPNKAEKEIKLQLKFAQSVEDNKKAFNDLLFEATQVDESTAEAAANQIIKTIDSKFKGAKGQFAGLRAALVTAIADPNTPNALKQLLMNFNWDAVGTTAGAKIGAAIKTGVTDIFGHGGGLDFGEGGGGLVVPVVAPVIPKPVTTDFDAGVKTLTTNVANIAKTVPAISVDNKPAIKAIDAIAKRIDSLSKINPQIPVNNKPAIKAVDVIAKRIDSLSKLNPDIKVNNKPAIKAIDVIAKRITSLPTGNVTVKVNYDTSGKPAGVKAQHGFHGTLSEDTTILAHKGERVDIGRANGSGMTRSSGGGGGGGSDTFYFNIHFGDKAIVQKVKAELGRSVYTMGA